MSASSLATMSLFVLKLAKTQMTLLTPLGPIKHQQTRKVSQLINIDRKGQQSSEQTQYGFMNWLHTIAVIVCLMALFVAIGIMVKFYFYVKNISLL